MWDDELDLKSIHVQPISSEPRWRVNTLVDISQLGVVQQSCGCRCYELVKDIMKEFDTEKW